MMFELTEKRKKILLVAANWWFDRFEAPTFDNGDPSCIGVMTAMMANSLAKCVNDPSFRSRRGLFCDAFINACLNQQSNWLDRRFSIDVRSDYGPSQFLAEVMDKAGVNHVLAPWKTMMSIRDDGVGVSIGYSGEFKKICDGEGELI